MGTTDAGHTYQGDCEPQRAVGYKPETVYEARVETGDGIHFMFYHSSRASHVQIKRSDVSDSGWLDYLLIPDVDLYYHAPNGVWILHTSKECNPTWLFKVETAVKKGLLYKPIIAETPYKPSIAELQHKSRWGEESERQYSLKPKYMKEVKGKMYLQLIDVTIFNRKTKHIDFHENIVTENNDEAYLLAVQAFGKYDPKVHVKAAKCILGFNEIGDEVEE